MNYMNNTQAKKYLSRVPEITVYFWILKFFTTAMGESTSDSLVYHMNPYIAVAIGALAFAIALIVKLIYGKYTAVVYWFTALMVAIFGTMAADVIHVAIGVPYIDSTAMFALMLAGIFVVWFLSEKTLSIHSIYTLRREIFYWSAVFTTFALGTAAGDLTASTFGLGYFSSGLLFGFLIAIVAIAYQIVKRRLGPNNPRLTHNAVIAYWTAYILTRPFGASFADWMDKPVSVGGLGLGDVHVSIYLFIPIIFFVWFLATGHGKTKRTISVPDNETEKAYAAK